MCRAPHEVLWHSVALPPKEPVTRPFPGRSARRFPRRGTNLRHGEGFKSVRGWWSSAIARHGSGMMCVMDQADAIVWASALGIAGTFAAGLIGPVLQARASRRQDRDHEVFRIQHR